MQYERQIDENTDLSTLTDQEIMRLMEGMDVAVMNKVSTAQAGRGRRTGLVNGCHLRNRQEASIALGTIYFEYLRSETGACYGGLTRTRCVGVVGRVKRAHGMIWAEYGIA